MIRFYIPKFEDLWFRQQLLEDPETMSYNHAYGGTIDFPEDRWEAWYSKWIADTGGDRWYRYLQPEDGSFVGEAALHFDEDRGIWIADILIAASCRGKGFGRAALEMLCEEAGKAGITELYDDIASDEPAVGMFLKAGFTEDCRTDEYIMLKKTL